MNFYLVKKEKNRIYKSRDIVMALTGQELNHNQSGAPVIGGAFISVSDTAHYWACSISDFPAGIDIEEKKRKLTPSAVSRLHKAEQDYLSVLSFGSSEWTSEFLSIWTKKESFSKYMQKGLALDFRSFCVLDGGPGPDIRTYSFEYKDLVIGSTFPLCFGDITEYEYDAPFEKNALDCAADMLDISGCSSSALVRRLRQKGYSDEASACAAARLQELGYLNDGEYARSLSEKFAQRGYSSKKIYYELTQKGVPADIASEYKDIYKVSDEERALCVCDKLIKGSKASDKAKLKTKIAGKLNSCGYDASIIYDIIEKLN